MYIIPYDQLKKADPGALKTWYEKHGNDLFYEQKEKGKRGRFNANLLALYLTGIHPTITLEDTNEVWRYNETTGNYDENGDKRIEQTIQKMFKENYTQTITKLTLATIKPMTYLDREDFTLPRNLIPVKNGILLIPAQEIDNPKTWRFESLRLIPNSPNYYVTNRIPVNYDNQEDYPYFKRFLNQVLTPDAIPFLQEYCGYLLYRGFPFHKTILITGPTNTGKSTLIRTITSFVGQKNNTSIALQDLEDKFQRVRLYQKLLNTVSDISSKALLDSSWFKQVTGNDYISAERKYQQGFQFIPYAKHIWSCNRIPVSNDVSDAFYNRIWILIMNKKQHYPDAGDTDHYLVSKLTTPSELSGILNWALEGLERLLKNGCFTNDRPADVTREIWNSCSDPLAQFMNSEWVIWDVRNTVSKDKLWSHFQFYCREYDIVPLSRNGFFKEINKRYVSKGSLQNTRPSGKGGQVYSIQGIGLNMPREVFADRYLDT